MRPRYLTQVQNASVLDILSGIDVLVKAKTGTGKTLGFLIPAIELLIQERAKASNANRAASRDGGRSAPAVMPRILVLSPTRELAQQIATEALNPMLFIC